eukprot:CAMPEP_0115221190 /NCGR_PEP_ID=MMETSP0270-20121206/27836_1 /TAXON_ID=71861 /ORGANISM="Scrippsiella trochoidea, Strain CCMP3099" /LENGTH=114 /DNA_ID=CAMNT_0002635271 /DNA_START=69 /DNA_END=409 /DNA_ORIENTATION=+
MNRSSAAVAVAAGFSLAPAFITPAAPSQHPQLRGVVVSSLLGAPESAIAPSGVSCVAGALVTAAVSAAAVCAKRQVSTRAAVGAVACRAFDASAQPGVTPPLGFFDPAGICKDV